MGVFSLQDSDAIACVPAECFDLHENCLETKIVVHMSDWRAWWKVVGRHQKPISP